MVKHALVEAKRKKRDEETKERVVPVHVTGERVCSSRILTYQRVRPW